MKRQRWMSGDIVKIPLNNGTHCYGWIIRAGLVEFLDENTTKDLAIEIITKRTKLFTVFVFRTVISKGEWEIVGNAQRHDESSIFKFFMQDMITKKLSIYFSTGASEASYIAPATFEECEMLERMAVWNACHVEDRLISYYGGTPRFPVNADRPIRVLN